MSRNFKGWKDAEHIAIPIGKNATNLIAGKFFEYFIGIDGGTTTGFAVWKSSEKRFVEIVDTDFWGCIDKLKAAEFCFKKENIVVVVEDPSKNKPVFLKGKKSVAIGEHKKLMKIAQDVGGVKRETKLIIKWLEDNHWTRILVRPSTAKADAQMFEKITGLKLRLNPHKRDAALLVFGR